jgi:hypothetical protein
VVGEWERGAYCFVEFEDARKDSVFKKQGAKATREWGARFDHGYSQIIDWFHKLDGRSPGIDLLARFGLYEIQYEAILVIGRDAPRRGRKTAAGLAYGQGHGERQKIICMTFDSSWGNS